MMRTRAVESWCLTVALATAAYAGAREPDHHPGHGAHEHGVAQVDIVVDQRAVHIELESPAMNLVGFEHPPRNDRERAALQDAVAALNEGDRLVALSDGARCSLQDVHVISALLDEDGESHEDDPGHHDHDPHADLFIAWLFECAAPDVLREIGFHGLFARFPGTTRLRVQAATPAGQTSAALTPGAAVIRW
jgi:hypothetical protein